MSRCWEMPFGTKYRTDELDSHLSGPLIGAAIANRVTFDAKKFSSSHVPFFRSSMHISVGVLDVHWSIPMLKRRLKAV